MVKKKVAVITCHTPQNYGAMLQAYGLQKYLLSQDVNPEIIDYSPDLFLEELSLVYVGNSAIKNSLIKKACYILFKLPQRLHRRKNFNSFKNRFLKISKERYRSIEDLEKTNLYYDTFICGSDQIWNTKGVRGWNPVFYLQFVKDLKKRNSYAASMSLDLPITEEVRSKVLPMISDINMISVREAEIADLLRENIGKEVKHVLDPVFLLDSDAWGQLADNASPERHDYILIYPMGNGEHVLKNARIISEETDLPIYCISASAKKMSGVSKQFDCSVPKFVRLFRDAKYVITNSFHGTSFSIIFQKNFWACEVENNNHRITGILEQLNLKDRYVPKNQVVNIQLEGPDFYNVHNLLKAKINCSKEFLNKIINDAK